MLSFKENVSKVYNVWITNFLILISTSVFICILCVCAVCVWCMYTYVGGMQAWGGQRSILAALL